MPCRDLAAILELDSLHSVDLLGNPLSGAVAAAQIAALRDRGVTVRVLTAQMLGLSRRMMGSSPWGKGRSYSLQIGGLRRALWAISRCTP